MKPPSSSRRPGSGITTATKTDRDAALLAGSGLLFLASAIGTLVWCRSMSAGMPMPGGWTMSMAWMRMSDRTWLFASTSFMGMWMVMMAAMMMPSLVPMLASYRRGLAETRESHVTWRTAIAGAGYFFVWALIGTAVYPLGVLLGEAEMRWTALARAVPIATGGVLLVAGGIQRSAWKARRLARCRDTAGCAGMKASGSGSAWRCGLRLGLDCSLCCSSLMAALLAGGVMDVGVMALVAAAITTERLAPNPERTARAIGSMVMGVGAVAIARALGGI